MYGQMQLNFLYINMHTKGSRKIGNMDARSKGKTKKKMDKYFINCRCRI